MYSYEEDLPSARSWLRNPVPGAMSLTALEGRCMTEVNNYRNGKPSNDQYCLEIFHRAMVKHDHDAWEVLQRCFGPTVRAWMHHHPQRDIVCRYEPEENFVAHTFTRVWQVSMRHTLEFDSLASALSYLKLSLHGAVIDTLRVYARPNEGPLPDAGSEIYCAEVSKSEDHYECHELWDIIKGLLPDKCERRLAYLLYHCGLKPREIVRYCPGEFSDVQKIYHLTRNIMERLKRNRDQIRRRLSSEA